MLESMWRPLDRFEMSDNCVRNHCLGFRRREYLASKVAMHFGQLSHGQQ